MTNTARGHLRRTVTVTTVAAATAALAGFGVISNLQAEQASDLHRTALHAVRTEARLGDRLAATSKKVRTEGRAAIDAATGKTLTVKETAAAEKHLVTLDKATHAMTDAAAAAKKTVSDNTGAHVAYWRLSALDDRLGKVTLAPERTALVAAQHAVTADKQHLADAVTAWQKEQDRIAAEKAAAAKAAKAAEEQAASARAASQQQHASAAPHPAGGGSAPAAAAPQQAAANSPAPAPAAAPSKLAIAQGVFARYGFTNVTYGPGVAKGHYGATSLDAQHIYIDLDRIPTSRVASVAIHEYQHIKQARMYGGYDAVVSHYGSVIAMERAADQMARADGATWTNYA